MLKSALYDDIHIIRFAPQGSLIEFSPKLHSRPIKSSKRGVINGFSVRSRSRLNKTIAKLSVGVLPCFVTLTYHEEIPSDFQGYKYHLHHFLITLFRQFKNAGVMWKLEFQERGFAHYHLFIWGVSLEDLRAFVPKAWNNIAGYSSEYHLAFHNGELGNEHCVQPIRSWNGVRSYASKYFAKLDKTYRGGRIWGKCGNIPFSKIIEFRVNMEIAVLFRQKLQLEKKYEFSRLGFWTFDYSPDWLIFLYELLEFNKTPPCPDDPPDWDLDPIPDFE